MLKETWENVCQACWTAGWKCRIAWTFHSCKLSLISWIENFSATSCINIKYIYIYIYIYILYIYIYIYRSLRSNKRFWLGKTMQYSKANLICISIKMEFFINPLWDQIICRLQKTSLSASILTELKAKINIDIIIIIIIMSCRQHGYPWPSLVTSPYHSSPPAGLQRYILCLHNSCCM